jgi:hypothetical protein
MNGVLLISYYFPPDGGAGVYRPLRFVRQLPAMGWHPSVITVNGDGHDRYDPGLLKSVPEGIEIVRVSDRDVWRAIQTKRTRRFEQRVEAGASRTQLEAAHHRPVRSFLRGIVRRAEGWFYYPDRARPWIRPAIRATVTMCQRSKPRVLLVTGGPWSSFLVAHEVFRRTRVPYVLDFRDSWTLTLNEDFEIFQPKWARKKDRKLLRRLFEDAQAVVFRYEAEAECYWRAYPGALKEAKIHIIPNGYEGTIEQFEAAAGDRCTLLYTGTVVPYRYDTFLQGLSLLQRTFPEDAKRLRVVFVGEGVNQVAQTAASLGLTPIVETMEPVPSREVARMQREAHALFLLGVKEYQGYELCGSKVFAYMRAGRPILGILPEDESRKVLEHVGVSTIASIDSPKEIADALQSVVVAWSKHRLPSLLPDPNRCIVYEAANQTSALVRALEGRSPLVQFVPGSVEVPKSLQGKIGREGWLSTAS